MSLAALHWKKLLPTVPATATIGGILDAIYSALGAATYYDGSARTPGSGSAWTVSRYQAAGITEAVYASPPTVTALAQRVILAGSATAKTPTMRAPDTWATNIVLCGVNKNSGAFNAWDAALPFTNGQWFGYWKTCGTTSISYVHVFECEEALAVLFETATGTMYGCILGALLDPESTDALDAESDGRLYGMITSGSSTTISVGFLSIAAAFLGYSTSASYYHAGVFAPGVGSIYLTARRSIWATSASATSGITKSGRPTTTGGILMRDYSGDEDLGTLRQVRYGPAARTGRRLRQGGSDIAYVYGCVSTSDDDCIYLMA